MCSPTVFSGREAAGGASGGIFNGVQKEDRQFGYEPRDGSCTACRSMKPSPGSTTRAVSFQFQLGAPRWWQRLLEQRGLVRILLIFSIAAVTLSAMLGPCNREAISGLVPLRGDGRPTLQFLQIPEEGDGFATSKLELSASRG